MRVAFLTTLVCAAALLAACGQPSSGPPAAEEEARSAPAIDPETQKLLAALPAPYNGADLENGQRKFALCRSCHTITPGGANLTGPNLHGVFGRPAGAVEKFRYSEPVKTAGFVWDADHLDRWLADPRGFLPGNRMTFVGVKEPRDRVDLIAFLMVETARQPGG